MNPEQMNIYLIEPDMRKFKDVGVILDERIEEFISGVKFFRNGQYEKAIGKFKKLKS